MWLSTTRRASGKSTPVPLLLRAAVYAQVKNFHVETVSRLELKFQANSLSPLKWTRTNFFSSPLKRTCAMKLGIYSEAQMLNLDLCVHRSFSRLGGRNAV